MSQVDSALNTPPGDPVVILDQYFIFKSSGFENVVLRRKSGRENQRGAGEISN